jgi:predicted DNA-binding transcriptional regulator AlpA
MESNNSFKRHWSKKVLRLDEVSKVSGIKESTILIMIGLNQIPFSKPHARSVFFDSAKIREWLNDPVTADLVKRIEELPEEEPENEPVDESGLYVPSASYLRKRA